MPPGAAHPRAAPALHEACTVLSAGLFTFIHPAHVGSAAWDECLPALRDAYPNWSFVPGFRED